MSEKDLNKTEEEEKIHSLKRSFKNVKIFMENLII